MTDAPKLTDVLKPKRANRTEAEVVARWLNKLSVYEFVSFFYEHLADRHTSPSERRHLDSHLVLANARRDLEDDGKTGAWRLELLCATPEQKWTKDASVCQSGTCCGHVTSSWSKISLCPVCGSAVRGS